MKLLIGILLFGIIATLGLSALSFLLDDEFAITGARDAQAKVDRGRY